MTRRIVSVLLAAFACMGLSATCSPGDNTKDEKYTVTFDTNGGIPDSISSIEVAKGKGMGDQYPANPTKEGFKFRGWLDGGNRYDSTTPVNQNLNLTARWEANESAFHVYLAFGQSNMVGYLGPGGSVNAYTANVPENFKVMAAANNGRNPQSRQMGEWYSAVPPLCRSGTGLSPSDFFGRTIADAVKDKGITVGVIVVAVDGCAINLFSKDKNAFKTYIRAQPDWMRGQAAAYVDASVGNTIPTADFETVDYPYQRLVDLARRAQETGVIKGIIMHQGESGASSGTYNTVVRKIYDDLCEDLGLQKGVVPFLAGQAVGNNNGNIASIPNAFTNIPGTAFVIPSDGCTAWNPSGSDNNERIHFSLAGYEELGKRYGEKMLDLLYK
ncbi:MAG: InlB B-repeat-containing protein [Treponema sp.]|jgi:uncharacterized repeat protein (TIGR02543 family)|nr:InlB B-repeat-containing protein [Treponema sp.]